MNEESLESQSRRLVFEITLAMKKQERMLPAQVFSKQWGCFLFFQSDYIFSPDFVSIINALLDNEQSSLACLVNIDRATSPNLDIAEVIFFDYKMNAQTYGSELRTATNGLPWIFGVDSYICTSHIGEWCIYCEKRNDVAVIALRDSSSKDKFFEPLRALHAETIENLLSDPSAAIFPFNQLVPSWVTGLLENYGDHA